MAHAIVIVQMIWCPWNEAELVTGTYRNNETHKEDWAKVGGLSSSASVYYCQHKPNTTMTGLGTRLAENDLEVLLE